MTLEKACKRLIIREPFWGMLLLGYNKMYSTRIPTLAVAKSGLGLELLVNKEFWDKHTDDEQTALLLHELHHIAFFHMTMGEDFPDKKLFNMAADLECNSYIENLPDGALLAKNFNFDPQQGTKYYYEKLQQQGYGNSGGDDKSDGQASNKSGGGKDGGKSGGRRGDNSGKTLDDHSLWKEFDRMDPAAKEVLKDAIAGQIKEVAQSCQARGLVPGYMQGLVDGLLKEKPRIYDWRREFRRMLGTEIDVKFRKTYQRESRRFPKAPGIKMARKVRVLVGVDTSGSISDNDLADFFSEISHLCKCGGSAHILEFDSVIADEWDFDDLRHVKITGRGGTDFEPAVNYYRKHIKEYTLFVIFTDGYAPVDDLNVPRNDMLWVVTADGWQGKYPGKVVRIPRQTD